MALTSILWICAIGAVQLLLARFLPKRLALISVGLIPLALLGIFSFQLSGKVDNELAWTFILGFPVLVGSAVFAVASFVVYWLRR
jgi:ABC-type transport system involved in cytochrome c biogenesis permease subunit